MKFVSLFTKAPNYKRFSYAPRFYDKKAEERKEREQRLAQQKQEDPKDRINHDEPDEWEPERPIS